MVHLNQMKYAIFIIGLILSGSGLYLSVLGFTQIDQLEVMMLGLYLGASFILMTMGLYMMLVIFMKKKVNQVNDEEESVEEILFDLDDDEDIKAEILDMAQPTSMIEDTMVLNLFEVKEDIDKIESKLTEEALELVEETSETEDDLDVEDQYVEEEIELETEEDLIIPEEDTEDLLEEIISKDTEIEKMVEELEEKPLENLIDEIEEVQEINTEDTLVSDAISTQKVFTTDFMEARLIGIESFGIQRTLKKLTEDTEVTLKENLKHGLKTCEIFYQNKSIGYLSKVDYNKMVDKLPSLYKITISTFVYENNKVATVILNFMFKQ